VPAIKVLASVVIGVCVLGAGPLLTPLKAHEIGTTRVAVIALDESRFDIEVATDATALLEKMETVAGEQITETSDPSTLQDRLDALGVVFAERVSVSFGGIKVPAALRWSVTRPTAAGASPTATVRLTGDVPADAGPLTWKYSWTFTAYSLTDRRSGDGATTEWLDGDKSSSPLPLLVPTTGETRSALVARYVVLGFTHILPKGLDHVLFVLGIFLLSRRVRPILLQVTAFTIAHSITLALSIYDVVSVPAAFVEPAIALSIAYIALENVFLKDLRPWRYGLVFAFGLLHGLGFAGVLKEVGLPSSEFLAALFGFNVGVELGQLAVIGVAFLLVGFWFRDRSWYRSRIVLPASLVIACAGFYWTLERLNLIA
jgi:hydrogenase/urease accessory protein HupE